VRGPEESDGSDEAEIEARSTSYSSLSDEGCGDSDQSDEGYYTKEEFSPKDFQVIRRPVTCIDTIGSGRTDPFQTLPNLAGGDTEVLTHHCMYQAKTICHYMFFIERCTLISSGNTVFINLTTPPGPRKRWFPSSIGDPVFFHGIMHISASHIAGAKRSRPSQAYFQHRGEVIRLINKRITCGQNATSDGTICAIACLLISDVCVLSLWVHRKFTKRSCIEHVWSS